MCINTRGESFWTRHNSTRTKPPVCPLLLLLLGAQLESVVEVVEPPEKLQVVTVPSGQVRDLVLITVKLALESEKPRCSILGKLSRDNA